MYFRVLQVQVCKTPVNALRAYSSRSCDCLLLSPGPGDLCGAELRQVRGLAVPVHDVEVAVDAEDRRVRDVDEVRGLPQEPLDLLLAPSPATHMLKAGKSV